MVELLKTLSMVSYIVSGVLLLLGIALFFLLDIPGVIGELSGKTAKKAIENIRQQNLGDNSVNGRNTSDNVRVTDKISRSGKVVQEYSYVPTAQTEKISTKKKKSYSNETTVLNQESNETTVLQSTAEETTILNAQLSSETTILSVAEAVSAFENETNVNSYVNTFVLEVELGFSESSEYIE